MPRSPATEELLMITPRRCSIIERDHAASDQPGPLQIDVDHGVPGILGQLVSQAVAADARVVEQDVDAAELVGGGMNGGADRIVVADVGGEGQAVHAECPAFMGQGSRSSAEPMA